MASTNPRQITIEFPEDSNISTITSGIHSGSMLLREVLCSEDELDYVGCNSNRFEATIYGLSDVTGKKIQVKATQDNVTTTIFTGYIDSCSSTSDRTSRSIVAYDALYKYADNELITWYARLFSDVESITLKQLRDALFSSLSITQVTTTLVNDSLPITRNSITTNSLSFINLIKYICGANGVLGNITRDGQFEYIKLKSIRRLSFGSYVYTVDADITDNFKSGESSLEDYIVKDINAVTINFSDNSGYTAPTHYTSVAQVNNLFLSNNPLLSSIGFESVSSYISSVAEAYVSNEYEPADISMIVGDMSIKLGDRIKLIDRFNNTRFTYVLENEYSGVQLFNQKIVANGSEYRQQTDDIGYQEQINDISSNVDNLVDNVDNLSEDVTTVSDKIGWMLDESSTEEELTLTDILVTAIENQIEVGSSSVVIALTPDDFGEGDATKLYVATSRSYKGIYVYKSNSYYRIDLEIGTTSGTAADGARVSAIGIDLTAHLRNTTIHVTSKDKDNWNAKSDLALGETEGTAYDGLQGKTTTDNLTSHTSDSTIHITSAERTKWNNKSNLTLGETASTAYAGSKGKANADAIAILQANATDYSTITDINKYSFLSDNTEGVYVLDATDEVIVSNRNLINIEEFGSVINSSGATRYGWAIPIDVDGDYNFFYNFVSGKSVTVYANIFKDNVYVKNITGLSANTNKVITLEAGQELRIYSSSTSHKSYYNQIMLAVGSTEYEAYTEKSYTAPANVRCHSTMTRIKTTNATIFKGNNVISKYILGSGSN